MRPHHFGRPLSGPIFQSPCSGCALPAKRYRNDRLTRPAPAWGRTWVATKPELSFGTKCRILSATEAAASHTITRVILLLFLEGLLFRVKRIDGSALSKIFWREESMSCSGVSSDTGLVCICRLASDIRSPTNRGSCTRYCTYGVSQCNLYIYDPFQQNKALSIIISERCTFVNSYRVSNFESRMSLLRPGFTTHTLYRAERYTTHVSSRHEHDCFLFLCADPGGQWGINPCKSKLTNAPDPNHIVDHTRTGKNEIKKK